MTGAGASLGLRSFCKRDHLYSCFVFHPINSLFLGVSSWLFCCWIIVSKMRVSVDRRQDLNCAFRDKSHNNQIYRQAFLSCYLVSIAFPYHLVNRGAVPSPIAREIMIVALNEEDPCPSQLFRPNLSIGNFLLRMRRKITWIKRLRP